MPAVRSHQGCNVIDCCVLMEGRTGLRQWMHWISIQVAEEASEQQNLGLCRFILCWSFSGRAEQSAVADGSDFYIECGAILSVLYQN